MSLRIFDVGCGPVNLELFDWFRLLRASTGSNSDASTLVNQIIGEVAAEGDEAVVRYMRRWTDPAFDASRIVVKPNELTNALNRLDPALRQALEGAIQNVREYQQHIKPVDATPTQINGAELGLRFIPVDRVGLAVPGGKASYPSTVIMLAVPAMVAGVSGESIHVVTPPPTASSGPSSATVTTSANRNLSSGAGAGAGDVSPLVLATCEMLGIKHVYRIGGAQAIAALAVGTKTIPAVDLIAGPGNIYTQLAKLAVSGQVGIDGFYGPSEVVVVADETADPARVAVDLIAQAEHDPGRCFLVAWSRSVIEKINDEITSQLTTRHRRQAVEKSLAEGSAAVLVKDADQAAQVANQIAAEHVNLAVANPEAWLTRMRHGGEFFLGDQTPVAAGDYWAGPSHCLPTGTTARFASGVSVYTFLKRCGTVHYRHAMPKEAIDAIARLATAEGLDGHAESVRRRDTR